jgi:hypothetical protein
LSAFVPSDVVKRTFAVQIIIDKFAIIEIALDEFAARKIRASKCAPVEVYADEDSQVEERPIPITVLDFAANENRVNLTTVRTYVGKVTVVKNVVGPPGWLLKAVFKLLRFKKHNVIHFYEISAERYRWITQGNPSLNGRLWPVPAVQCMATPAPKRTLALLSSAPICSTPYRSPQY